ncbi:MAG: hypothetical protein A2284_19220 [Deltaproteobacteria bacterium RIFOXYA12_FULL_61_11]|nr:MAG: hypothetical protein A2284_19220 [Deltaproteobacteria bacterium RIFOXYA12_FULL_61_11]
MLLWLALLGCRLEENPDRSSTVDGEEQATKDPSLTAEGSQDPLQVEDGGWEQVEQPPVDSSDASDEDQGAENPFSGSTEGEPTDAVAQDGELSEDSGDPVLSDLIDKELVPAPLVQVPQEPTSAFEGLGSCAAFAGLDSIALRFVFDTNQPISIAGSALLDTARAGQAGLNLSGYSHRCNGDYSMTFEGELEEVALGCAFSFDLNGLSCRCQILDTGMSCGETGHAIAEIGDGRIQVEGEDFFLFGTHYYPLFYESGTSWLIELARDPEKAEKLEAVKRDLTKIRNLTLNHVTVTWHNFRYPEELPEYCTGLQLFLEAAEEFKLKVTLQTIPFSAVWNPNPKGAWKLYEGNEEKLANLLQSCYLQGYRQLIGYMLEQEPTFELEEQEMDLDKRVRNWAEVKDAWVSWVEDRYGTTENFATVTGVAFTMVPTDGVLCPESDPGTGADPLVANYRAFLTWFLSKRLATSVWGLKALDDTRIIYYETGKSGGDIPSVCRYLNWNPRYLTKDVDMVSFDSYNLLGGQNRVYVNGNIDVSYMNEGFFLFSYFKTTRPLMIGEYGYDVLSETHSETTKSLTNQKLVYEKFFSLANEAGLAGLSNWWLIGRALVETRTSDFGVLREDDYTGRPAVSSMKAFEHVDGVKTCNKALVVDEDEFTSETAFYLKHRDDYRQKCPVGGLPKVVTRCSGITSKTDDSAKYKWACQGCTESHGANAAICSGHSRRCELKCFKSEIMKIGADRIVVANTGEGTWKDNVKLKVGTQFFDLPSEVEMNGKVIIQGHEMESARGEVVMVLDDREFGERGEKP